MKELVFLLEEDSARALLESLLPRFLDPRVQPRLLVFEGKQDLEKQMVRRMRGYINPEARFIVLRDQDNAPDCKVIKAKLLALCANAKRQSVSIVRIACRELESFYLADLAATEVALQVAGLVRHQNMARLRRPDQVESPSRELTKLSGGRYQKVSGSRQIGRHLELTNERSASFKNLLSGVRRMESELLALPHTM